MSRARPIILPEALIPLIDEEDKALHGCKYWFNVYRNGEVASDRQLELLAVVEDVDIDDLLDTVITQGEVLKRLRFALGQDPIPTEVLERRQRWREERQLQPQCVKCGKKGDSTRHHFVNKWILKELQNYTQKWADRSRNCIPLCLGCHRHLHQRDDEGKSIVEYLSDEQRDFAEAALTALSEERPRLMVLIARGDSGVYETQLIRSWIEGRFAEPKSMSDVHLLRAVG